MGNKIIRKPGRRRLLQIEHSGHGDCLFILHDSETLFTGKFIFACLKSRVSVDGSLTLTHDMTFGNINRIQLIFLGELYNL